MVDVARNRYVASSLQLVKSEAPDGRKARALSAAEIAGAFKRYGIVRGNSGERRAQPAPDAKRVRFTRGRGYEITLREIERPVQNCLNPTGRLLEITLSRVGMNLILQRDARLPASRRCALSGMYAYNPNIAPEGRSGLAVFVRVVLDGFEGPDVRWMVVTGCLS